MVSEAFALPDSTLKALFQVGATCDTESFCTNEFSNIKIL